MQNENNSNLHKFAISTADNMLIDTQINRHKIQINFKWQLNEINIFKMGRIVSALNESIQLDATLHGTDKCPL